MAWFSFDWIRGAFEYSAMKYALRTYAAVIGLATVLAALTAIADETPARRALQW